MSRVIFLWRKTMWLQLVVLVAFVLGQQVGATSITTSEQEQPQPPGAIAGGSLEDLEGMDLHSLSDEELETICSVRGFELYEGEINEDTGNEFEFSHEDYVEAAKQCLAVEREMNEILAEHPELLDELQTEVDHMVTEKERLEQELVKAEKKREEAAASSEKRGTAFVPHGQEAAKGTTEQPPNVVEGDGPEITGDEQPSNRQKEEDVRLPEVVETTNEERNNEVLEEIEEKLTNESETTSEPDRVVTGNEESPDRVVTGNEESPDRVVNGNEELPEDTIKEIVEDTSSGEQKLGLHTLPQEVMNEIKKDLEPILKNVNKVIDVVFPKRIRGPARKALLQILRVAKDTGVSAVDMLERYMREIFKVAAKKYEQAKEANEKQQGTEEEEVLAL